ncbi:hypothetical protein V6Z12_A06G150400 [Gossypium hirsutum]
MDTTPGHERVTWARPLNITPLNPQSFACCAVTVPISTNRCFQIRLPVDISSNSLIREANCCVEESIGLNYDKRT